MFDLVCRTSSTDKRLILTTNLLCLRPLIPHGNQRQALLRGERIQLLLSLLVGQDIPSFGLRYLPFFRRNAFKATFDDFASTNVPGRIVWLKDFFLIAQRAETDIHKEYLFCVFFLCLTGRTLRRIIEFKGRKIRSEATMP